MKQITTLNDLDPDLQELAEILRKRDGSSTEDLIEQFNNALTELDSIVNDPANLDGFDETDFMSEHFGIEPDYYDSLLWMLQRPR